MRAQLHAPAPPLAPFVEYLWWLADAPAHARERIVPSGTLELVVNLHEDAFRIEDPPRRLAGAMVSGAHRAAFTVDTRMHAAIVGVHFRPGGARALLGPPPGELVDAHVELASLWGAAAAGELRERLCAAPTPARRVAILEQVLLARLRPRPRHPAVAAGLARLGGEATTVQALARDVALSHRRFIELFTAEVGMTPKRFARVRRFGRALALAQRIAEPDWPVLAVACGYFDQSHMIREFLELAGASPAALHALRGAPVKEHHIPAGGSNPSNTRGAPGRTRVP